MFDVLGFTPILGRPLLSDDNHAELPTVVVLGHGFWSRRFGADSGVVGRAINVEGFPMTVVGVMPASRIGERPVSLVNFVDSLTEPSGSCTAVGVSSGSAPASSAAASAI